MAKIGEYRDRVVILTRTLAAADATGEEVESWPDPAAGTGEHWAKLEGPAAGETLDETRQSYQTITLRFRHEVTLAPVDMVRLKDQDTDWTVTAVWQERNESGGWCTVCNAIGAS